MSRRTLETAWSVVATPYRTTHAFETRGKLKRRSSGEKGLGRLSAARLGKRLQMYTRAAGETLLACGSRLASDLHARKSTGSHARPLACLCHLESVKSSPLERGFEFSTSRRRGRTSTSRTSAIISPGSLAPFGKAEDFEIHLKVAGSHDLDTKISAPEFLTKPPYAIRGHVDASAKTSEENTNTTQSFPRNLGTNKSCFLGRMFEKRVRVIYGVVSRRHADHSSLRFGRGTFPQMIRTISRRDSKLPRPVSGSL